MFIVTKKLYNKAGLNPAIIYNILTRIVQSTTGILALLLITKFLNKNEQGYYYTFTSLVSLQIVFELGLTGIITQYIAHESAHLSWLNPQQISGDNYYKSRLASIVKFGIKWFLGLAIVLFLFLYISGQIFFSNFNSELAVNWNLPWLILSISTAFFLVINLFLAILEGLGKIEEVNKLRFLQQILNLVLLTLLFYFNLKLLSSGLALLISNLIIAAVVLIYYRKIFADIWHTTVTHKVDFKKEVFPYLYKLGLGTISGYFIWQIINPVLFATQGPVLAGQMGATQTFLNGILVISLSWLSTKVTLFSNLVAKKNFAELNNIYRKNLFVSFLVCLTGLLAFVTGIYLLKIYYPELGNRFLNVYAIFLLGLAQVVSLVGNAQAYYLRSFKQEPFFIPSLLIGIASGLFTVVCSKYLDINAFTFGYFIINGFIGFIWATVIFQRKTLEWTNTRLYI